jgi:hypothetical protein
MNEERHLNSPLVCLFGSGFRLSFGVSLASAFALTVAWPTAPACARRAASINPFAADGTATLTLPVNADISSLLTI